MTRSVFTDAYKIFLELLVAARKDAGVRQVDLSERLNWPQPTISNVERGIRRMDVVEFIAFARALDISPAELLSTIDQQLPDNIEI